MDIDHLDPWEEQRKQQNLCFHCGKPWSPKHHQECQNQPRLSGPPLQQRQKEFQGSKFQGKKPQQNKKKFSPSEARAHIRAIITENFDKDSAEYKEFVKEVEEKGF